MKETKSILISSAYLGPINYFAAMLQADEVLVEAEEHYIKQTYRNRCRIMTGNGILNLTIPVIKVNGNHTQMKDVEISYKEKWQQLHWRAILAAYSHSPYFLFYQDALEPFYHEKIINLFEFNQNLSKTVLALSGINKKIQITEVYQEKKDENIVDLRNAFSPKALTEKNLPGYIQVFEDRFGFVPDLSILDVLLNLGPETFNYLQKITALKVP